MTSKNSVDTIIYEILKEIPDRDTICALDRGGKTTQTRCAQTTQRVFCIFDHTTAVSFL